MTDDTTTATPKRDIDKLRLAITRHLRNIETLATHLHTQALATPNHHDFPGGTALAMIAPAHALQDWETRYDATERAERFDPNTGTDRWSLDPRRDPAIDQGDDTEHPLNVLATWTRTIRTHRNQPTNLAPTITREIDYLHATLDWATRTTDTGDPAWPLCLDLAHDLAALVHRMEDVLHDGTRLDTDAAPCFRIDPNGERCGGTLARIPRRPRECIHVQGARHWVETLGWLCNHYPTIAAAHHDCDQGGRDDLYRCLDCEKIYTPTEYWLAVREHMERESA